MREVLTVHEPLLVNTLGHLAGTLIFAIFLHLLLRDRVGARLRGSHLTITAAVLAFVWNFASLLVIAWNSPGSRLSELLVAISSSALSLLPSVLLHLSLGNRFPWIWRAGYALAAVTVGIHLSESALNSPENHEIALRMTSLGFGVLTLAAVAGLVTSPGDRKRLTPRLVGTMSLFLFSLSFVHLSAAFPQSWPVELIAHHAGIALALFVLLQDYRFLLLDAFLRFLANILLAAVFVFAIAGLWDLRAALAWANNPFREGLLLAGGCMLLLLFAFLRSRLDHMLSRMVSLKNDLEAVLQELRTRAASFEEESGFLDWAAQRIGEFFRAPLVRATEAVRLHEWSAALLPAPVSDLPASQREPLETLGVEAVLPLRLAANDLQYILLGRRQGGRRYLSEDFAALRRLQAELIEQMDRRRELEMRRLVSQAELRALQSQIHPHFLFNALNTLYGIIPREAAGARRTVLNLADIFRYFLQSERTFIPLAKEMEIVRAYLEIEALRLGNKLETQIDVAADALLISIPVLTVEPLVENAVKHGVAKKAEGGLVRVEARVESGSLRIRVCDTGAGFQQTAETVEASGTGVGLENVLRRLRLCYGPDAGLLIESSGSGSSVGFLVPNPRSGGGPAMRVLIADDEPIARQVLREILGDISGIDVVGEAATGPDALRQASVLYPDVLLLDLQMPGMNGFQVAEHLPSHRPAVIFVTAYEKHALEAFDAGAVDYLLKPVRKERLEAALTKARSLLAGSAQSVRTGPVAEIKRIAGRSGTDLHLLDLADVVGFQADGDVVYVITASSRYYADHTLKALEQRLPDRFRRVHRGTIINTDHIRKISPLSSKRWLLRMTNGMEVIVSKRLAGLVREGSW